MPERRFDPVVRVVLLRVGRRADGVGATLRSGDQLKGPGTAPPHPVGLVRVREHAIAGEDVDRPVTFARLEGDHRGGLHRLADGVPADRARPSDLYHLRALDLGLERRASRVRVLRLPAHVVDLGASPFVHLGVWHVSPLSFRSGPPRSRHTSTARRRRATWSVTPSGGRYSWSKKYAIRESASRSSAYTCSYAAEGLTCPKPRTAAPLQYSLQRSSWIGITARGGSSSLSSSSRSACREWSRAVSPVTPCNRFQSTLIPRWAQRSRSRTLSRASTPLPSNSRMCASRLSMPHVTDPPAAAMLSNSSSVASGRILSDTPHPPPRTGRTCLRKLRGTTLSTTSRRSPGHAARRAWTSSIHTVVCLPRVLAPLAVDPAEPTRSTHRPPAAARRLQWDHRRDVVVQTLPAQFCKVVCVIGQGESGETVRAK